MASSIADEYRIVATEIVEFLLHHHSISDFDRNLIQMKYSDIVAYEQLHEIVRQNYEGFDSLQNKKHFIMDQVSRKVASYSMDAKRQIFNEVFASMPVDSAKKLAKNAEKYRDEEAVSADTILSGEVYGEIEFPSFANILQRCMVHMISSEYTSNNPKLVFVDLGHGTGKSLIALSLLYGDKFSEAHGIEYAHGLYEESLKRIEHYLKSTENSSWFEKSMERSPGNVCKLIAHEGDFFSTSQENNNNSEPIPFDWTTADIVFANSTCFNHNMISKLGQLGENMKTGSLFITFTYPLPNALSINENTTPKVFSIIEEKNLPMSWGLATVFIHQRL